MTSLRKLAVRERAEGGFYTDDTRNVLIPALLEIAHAISRGRKPNSCSLLPGKNIREWLQMVFFETQPDLRDHMGEKCSYIVELEEALSWDNDQSTEAILRAIRLCDTVARPPRIPSNLRGDIEYQMINEHTNLKRKAMWLANKNGSCYDDYSCDLSY